MDTLRILVVDDDVPKMRQVLNCLESVPGCSSDQIHRAYCANDAKSLLRDNQYDLMILDIALPARSEEMPTREGGIALLEEVLQRDIYRKPREVIGLSAFPEVVESAGLRFAEDLWLVIHYDSKSDTWAQQLRKKIRHILLAKATPLVPDFGSYLCVVTALATPELSSVLQIPWSWEKHEIPGDPTIYYRGSVCKDGIGREVIVAAAPRMGMISTSVLAAKMIGTFRPRYLAMTGILAGISDRCSIGDVVAADPSWDWGSGKYYTDKGEHQFAAAPYQLDLNSFVRSKLSLLSNSASTLDEIRRGWPGKKADTILRMHVGPVASGASVLQDADIARSILKQHRKLVGIEMESYGLFAAGEEMPLPQPKVFSLKSVSDFADEAKTDEHQEFASYTSAMALKVFVERFL
jgi:nucleoside phosphorylase/CheY-like chemotaxis protein